MGELVVVGGTESKLEEKKEEKATSYTEVTDTQIYLLVQPVIMVFPTLSYVIVPIPKGGI